MTDRLPDILLEPPEEDLRPWEALSTEEKIERLCEDFTAEELARMYLDANGEIK